jgi:hypothetical protein
MRSHMELRIDNSETFGYGQRETKSLLAGSAREIAGAGALTALEPERRKRHYFR